MILKTVWLEEKKERHATLFALTVIAYRISENMTGTDKDHIEIDSRSLVSFCCENAVVFYLSLPNYGKLAQKVSPFG
jgi:hypothetical protein